MTDKFEEWLENRITFAAKQTKEELGLPYFHSVSGRKKAFEDALSQYREFLKEQPNIATVEREERAKLICSECGFPKEIEREPVFLKNDVISLLKYEDNVCGTCGCQKDGSTILIVAKKIRGVAERVRKIERERAVKCIEKYFTTAKGNRIYNPFVIHLSEKILEEK